MKTIAKLMVGTIVAIASTLVLNAQNNVNCTMDVNGNYKHMYPTSKGTKFKDSFKNDDKIDQSESNYKAQNPKTKKVRKSNTQQNVETSKKSGSVNSKHPYGL